MDLWNNAVGRELASKYKSKEALAKAIKDALKNEELITHPADRRPYQGAVVPKPEGDQSVIALKESPSGANEIFFDFNNSSTLTRAEFIAAIAGGQYPGYTIRRINGVDYPASRRDGSEINNLG